MLEPARDEAERLIGKDSQGGRGNRASQDELVIDHSYAPENELAQATCSNHCR